MKRLPRLYTLGVRLSSDERRIAKRAAKAAGVTLSYFSREAVLDRAKAVLEPSSAPRTGSETADALLEATTRLP